MLDDIPNAYHQVRITPPVEEFEITGTRQMEVKECPVCYEGKQEYISEDGRISACEECARIWTRETKTMKWLEIEPKN